MAEYIMNFRTTRLSADREVKRAIDIINTAIRSGSLVYLYELDNVNYSIKLRNPIGIAMVDMPEIEVKNNGLVYEQRSGISSGSQNSKRDS